jgi:hypothetical protein
LINWDRRGYFQFTIGIFFLSQSHILTSRFLLCFQSEFLSLRLSLQFLCFSFVDFWGGKDTSIWEKTLILNFYDDWLFSSSLNSVRITLEMTVDGFQDSKYRQSQLLQSFTEIRKKGLITNFASLDYALLWSSNLYRLRYAFLNFQLERQ